jgi:tetratricopeptide (TPR) repeat protein
MTKRSNPKSDLNKRANEWHKSLNDFIGKHSSDLPAQAMNDTHELMASHLVSGKKLQMQGLLSEAIVEFSKEHHREIKSSLDAEIAQTSYWHVGQVYRELGKIEQAITALQKAEELLEEHGVGTSPHYDLAEIFIEQGRVDDVIEACQKGLRMWPRDPGIKQKLAEAYEIKQQNR